VNHPDQDDLALLALYPEADAQGSRSAGDSTVNSTAAHVRGCGRCRTYVEDLARAVLVAKQGGDIGR